MKKLLIFKVLFSFIFLYIGSAQPQLEIIGGDTYDWGDVKGVDKVQAKVQIRNSGTELLKIYEVKPTCGCTTAPLDKNELKPGEIATLDITLSLSGRQNQVTKTIRIKSNDPNASEKVLWLKCNVIRNLSIPNKFLSYKDMTVGYEKEEKIPITNTSKENITLSDFSVDNPDLSINLQGKVVLKPGETKYLIGVAKPRESGNFRAIIKFKTTDPENPEVIINAFGKVNQSPIFNESNKK